MIPFSVQSKRINNLISSVENPIVVNVLTRWYTGPDLITSELDDFYHRLTLARTRPFDPEKIKRFTKIFQTRHPSMIVRGMPIEAYLAAFRFGHFVDGEFRVLSSSPSPLPPPLRSVTDFSELVESGKVPQSSNIIFLLDHIFAGKNFCEYSASFCANVEDRGYFFIVTSKSNLNITKNSHVLQLKSEFLVTNMLK